MERSHIEAFESLVGRRCTAATSNVGSMVALELPAPTPDPAAGDRALFVHFGEWMLARNGEAVLRWRDPRDVIIAGIAAMEGRAIERFGVHEASGASRCWFDDELTLTIRPCTYNATASWWQINDADGVLVRVGPGPTFRGPAPPAT